MLVAQLGSNRLKERSNENRRDLLMTPLPGDQWSLTRAGLLTVKTMTNSNSCKINRL
jgi:hypothetical protein